jgi:hypothetical protein
MYELTFDFRVAGIPAKIGVRHANCTPPWGGCGYGCPSDIDYYGEVSVEYDVLDARGRRAPWLERKVDKDIDSEICSAAAELMGFPK